MEKVETSIDRDVMEAARLRAGEEGRPESELIEDAVRYYLLAVGGRAFEYLLGHGVSEERRALARQRVLQAAGSGGMDEEEAHELALSLVRRAREEAPERKDVRPAPGPEAVRARLGRQNEPGAS